MPNGTTSPNTTTQAPISSGRVDAVQLEKIFLSMPRMQEIGKERVRDYLIKGMRLADIASRDAVSVESVANTVRRVRAKINEHHSPSRVGNQPSRGVHIVRARKEDLEKVMADMPRMEEQTKDRMRRHFLSGLSAKVIAAQDGIGQEAVINALRYVGAALAAQDIYWRQASFTVTLPVPLGKALQELSDRLHSIKRREDADALLEPIMRAVAKARKTLD